MHIPDDLAIDTPPHERSVQERLKVRAALLLPILSRDECFGVQAFDSRQPREFTEKDIALVERFRDQAVNANADVNLFNHTQEALAHQNSTSDILRMISRSPTDVIPIYNAIVDAVVRLLETMARAEFGAFLGSEHAR